MDYSLSALTTVADCDAVLAMLGKEKRALELRKLSLESQQINYAENTVEVTAELASKQAELDAITTVVAGLPDGDTKTDQIKKQKKLEYSIFLLTGRKADYGAVALIDKEYELEKVTKELEVTTSLMAQVDAHKATL